MSLKRLFAALSAPLLAILAVLAVQPAAGYAQASEPPAEQPAGPAHFVVSWEKLKPANEKIARKLRHSRAVERVVSAVNALVQVPQELGIVFTDDVEIGPAYLPDQNGQELHVIVVPGHFLRTEQDIFRKALKGVKGLSVNQAVRYATQFVIAHEIGHALVDQLDLPVTGKEEDAVDGFAAYLLTSERQFGPMGPVSAGLLFDGLSTPANDLDDSDFADEHSMPQQRVYQLLCWVYGSDTKRYRGLVGKGGLPKRRAVRCADEYKQLRSSWDRLLAPHHAAPVAA